MEKYRRAILPLGMVLGTLICAYIAFFVGVREDLPQPSGAERYPLSVSKQTLIAGQWPEMSNLATLDAAIYTLRENPTQAATYYRQAFVEKRGWTEITPPGQPKDRGADQQFSMLAFSKGNNRIYLALSNARPIYSNDSEFNKALRSNNIRESDNIALIITGVSR